MTAPFTLEDALRAGLGRWHLEGASWRRMGPNVYVWAGLPNTPELTLEAALRRLPSAAVFSGLTAAWLHGLDVGECETIEVTIPKGIGISARSGIEVRRAALSAKEIVIVRGKRATSILRTLSDLCIRLSLTEAVVVTDMALHARHVTVDDLKAMCVKHAKCFGVASLRRVVGLAEPAAESPMESRLRMVLVLGGLPRPQAQVSLHDGKGLFLGPARSLLPESPARARIRWGNPSDQPGRGQPPPESAGHRGDPAPSLHRRRRAPQSGLGHHTGAWLPCGSAGFAWFAGPRGFEACWIRRGSGTPGESG